MGIADPVSMPPSCFHHLAKRHAGPASRWSSVVRAGMGVAAAVGFSAGANAQIAQISVGATILPSCRISGPTSKDEPRANGPLGDPTIKSVCNFATPQPERRPTSEPERTLAVLGKPAAASFVTYATRVNRQDSDASQVIRYVLNY